jgi:hypothetical protein
LTFGVLLFAAGANVLHLSLAHLLAEFGLTKAELVVLVLLLVEEVLDAVDFTLQFFEGAVVAEGLGRLTTALTDIPGAEQELVLFLDQLFELVYGVFGVLLQLGEGELLLAGFRQLAAARGVLRL